ncbi:hypothetical protein IFR04_004663 [Cadophora malorum]|uniref:Uncharacterized protein n=1 Tax=Cadophora malorum TaxID=108018 RepID=A0A8H7WCA6_9HELO|nr:hypothetical protein IFR04_004663 [Cadophora malorum]
MASSNQAGGTTTQTGTTTTSGSRPQPLIKPRKIKWLQDDGHLIGIARRKGDKNPFRWNVEVDPQYARYAPHGWSPAFPPVVEKKKKKKAPSTNSSASGSGSDKKGEGVLGKLMFWKKGKGKARSSSAPASGNGTAGGTGSGRRGSSGT